MHSIAFQLIVPEAALKVNYNKYQNHFSSSPEMLWMSTPTRRNKKIGVHRIVCKWEMNICLNAMRFIVSKIKALTSPESHYVQQFFFLPFAT